MGHCYKLNKRNKVQFNLIIAFDNKNVKLFFHHIIRGRRCRFFSS